MWRSRGTAPLILNVCIRWKLVVNFRTGSFSFCEIGPDTHRTGVRRTTKVLQNRKFLYLVGKGNLVPDIMLRAILNPETPVTVAVYFLNASLYLTFFLHNLKSAWHFLFFLFWNYILIRWRLCHLQWHGAQGCIAAVIYGAEALNVLCDLH
jgi:hypothetical protein